MAILAAQKRSTGKATNAQRRILAGKRPKFTGQQPKLVLPTGSPAQLIDIVSKGLPISAFTSLSNKTGIPLPELASILRIPARTLARRRSSGRLTPDESERLMRLMNIFEKAIELFEGQIDAAVAWLKTPKKALSNHSPLEYTSFEIGAREVENLIGRLEHGIFS